MDAMLQIDRINKSFGGLRAVDGVSFSVNPGELIGLIGPNGAGKTTIFNMISGIYRIDSGSIFFDDVNITNRRPTQISRLGIARTFQVPRTFNRMTVEENLEVATLNLGLSENENIERVGFALSEMDLYESRYRNASELSGGQRQLLQFARATMTQPKLIILDEPFAGSNPSVIDLMIEKVHALAESGTATLVISHDIISLPRVCEEVVVLIEGAVLTQGKLSDVRQDPRVIDAYLGT